jgi:DNA-binding FadR family transcriptional regulator
VARELGIRIVSGVLKPGEILEGEIAASIQFNVSRTAYREAIRILAAKGLVNSRPKIGTQVSPRGMASARSRRARLDLRQRARRGLIESVRAAPDRRARCGAACGDAPHRRAARADAAGLDGVAQHGFATEIGRRCDEEFHSALLEASANDFIVSLTSGVAAAIAITTAFKQHRLPAPHDALPVHLAVFEAIEAQDAEGAHDAMAGWSIAG